MRKKTSFITVVSLVVLATTCYCFADVSDKFKQAQTHQEQR